MARHTNADRSRTHAPEANGRSDSGSVGRDSGGPKGAGRLSGIRAAALAQEQLEQLIQRPCESVSGLSRQPDGWAVTLEVVELERVPPTTDILATYRVELDQQGELMGYERLSRYYRNQAGGDS
jgi:hypothetical protein